MRRLARRIGLSLLLGACAWPAQAADPILMFLLSAGRDLIAAAEKRKLSQPPVPVAPPPGNRYPGTTVEPEALRRLVDECFSYLSSAQRSEIFDALNAALMDPRNASTRAAMIDYFVARAVAVRDAQQRLAGLSTAEQDRLVAEFKTAVAALSPDEATQMADLLRRGVLPVPSELGTKLLAAIDTR